MTTLNAQQQEALDIAFRYATTAPDGWGEAQSKEMKRLVQIVYDRPARYDEHQIYSHQSTARKTVVDAISRTGFFAPHKDHTKFAFYAFTVLSTIVTVGVWVFFYYRK